MNQRPPLVATLLTAAGVLPFAFGAALSVGAGWAVALADAIPYAVPRAGSGFLIHYGVVILSFMTGVLWGFATQADARHRTLAYSASVIPALYAFFFVNGDDAQRLTALIFGFIGLLAFDGLFAWMKLTPPWWRILRLPVTFAVIVCLGTALRGM